MFDYRGIREYLRESASSDESSSETFILAAERLPALRDVDRALSNVASIRNVRQRLIDAPDSVRAQVKDQMQVARRGLEVLRAATRAAEAAIEEAEDGTAEALESGDPDSLRFEAGRSAPASPPGAMFVPVPPVIRPDPRGTRKGTL